jgi:hypothetical protein
MLAPLVCRAQLLGGIRGHGADGEHIQSLIDSLHKALQGQLGIGEVAEEPLLVVERSLAQLGAVEIQILAEPPH